MFQAMQGGDALEIPAVDVQVKANGPIYKHTVVALRPTAADVEGDSISGRVRLRGCSLAVVPGDRGSYILGVAQDDASIGDYVRVRLQGCTQLAVLDHPTAGGAIADGEHLVLSGTGYVTKTVAATTEGGGDNSVGAAAVQGFRILAWSLESGTASGANALDATRFKVCFNGMGWGSDEYTEA